MKIRSLVLAALVVVFAHSVARADAPLSPQREAQIRKLLALTKAGEMGMQMMDQMSAQLKPMFPKVPAQFWTDFFKEVKADELVSKIVPIYGKYLTEAEIGELIKFYQSPIGQKLVSAQPMIMQESMVAGQQWGRELGERVVKRLQEKNLLDKK